MRLPQYILRNRLSALAVALILCLSASRAMSSDAATGETIFRDQCARCHGKSGEGTEDNYPDPLEGDKSVAQLTKLIHETMPDDADKKASPEDSAKVAEYIYDTFYSPEARVRNKPARIELSRLTVRQYQNVVADLIGSFLPKAEWGAERGLHAEYNQSREIGSDKKKHFERTDPTVDFDFGDASPDPKQLDADEFSIVWQGSVLAPDTGEYEFVIRTQHAARLYVNDAETPLIDSWVKSGDDAEHRGTIRLLGGRPYFIKLEFSKANQGVNDKKNHESHKPPAKAFIALGWKRPNHTVEIIPSRCLSTNSVPEVLVVQARFPPDDRSVGYERGTAISKAWDEATTEGAIEVAGYVTEHLQKLAGVSAESADSLKQLRKFCVRFAERAFRRPLPSDLKGMFIDRQFAKSADRLAGVKRVVLLVMKSPRFLYREVGGSPSDQFDTASCISFGLWDSLPDQQLTSGAKEGKLATHDQIAEQLQRMLPDLRHPLETPRFFSRLAENLPTPRFIERPQVVPGVYTRYHLRPPYISRTLARRRPRQQSGRLPSIPPD